MPQSINSITQSDILMSGNFQQTPVTYHNTYMPEQSVTIPKLMTNYIPTNAAHIVGRADELAAIDAYFKQNQRTVLLTGIGGMGKTTVAAKYIVQFGHQYAHIAWVTVLSDLSDALIGNALLLDALKITDKVKQYVELRQLDKAFETVVHHLALLDNTLVVIDNANDLTDLAQAKSLFDTAQSHFLITSRTHPQDWKTVEILVLPEAEALKIFRNINPAPQTTDDALKNLLAKLFYHTLLIELVAKAVKSAGLSIEEMTKMIETRFIHHEELIEQPVATGGHGNSLPQNKKYATIEDYIWFIFDNINTLSDKDKDILRGIALLPLATVIQRADLKEHLALFDLKEVIYPLTILVERGWLDALQLDGQKPSYQMHPLIVDVVIKHLTISIAFAEAYIAHIAKVIDYDTANPQHNLFKIKDKKPLGERLSDLFFNENTEGVSELLDNLGYLEKNLGFYRKSLEYREQALSIAETIFDENHKNYGS